MAKKGGTTKKSSSSRRKSTKSASHKEIELLVENFVSLQKVMTHMSEKFDHLSRQISELLKLFEDSAKVIVKSEMEKKKEDHSDKQLLDTMISILDQNKVIAKGLTLIYESMDNNSGVSSMKSSNMESTGLSKRSFKAPESTPSKNTMKRVEEPNDGPKVPSQYQSSFRSM